MRLLASRICVFLLVVLVTGSAPTAAQHNGDAVADNPALSNVESVRYLGAFINALATFHRRQRALDALKTDDFVGRMTQLRLMAADAVVSGKTLEPFSHSKNERIADAAAAASEAFVQYKSIFEVNIALDERLVRVFTVPHELTESETKAIAESRIQASQISALFAQASELLRDAAMLAFASAIVPAPGDAGHIALDMSAAQKGGFIKRLHRDFGELGKEKTLSGADLAAFTIMVKFEEDWRLAR